MSDAPSQPSPRAWWSARRRRYNVALVVAGLLAFAAYVAVVAMRCEGVMDVEITAFTIAFQGIGYLIMIGAANVCYQLGAALERLVPTASLDSYRRWTYASGLAFSVALPFLVPLVVAIRGCRPVAG